MSRRFRPEILFLRSLVPGVVFGALVWLLVSHLDAAPGAVVVLVLGLIMSSSLGPLLTGLAAGLYVQIERPFQIGDRVAINGRIGRVEAITVLRTQLRLEDGGLALEPNISLITAEILVDGTSTATPVH